jgi:predicted RNA-binding Zn-ribbon protein involved in translation (DUF1610 family)
MNEETDVNGMDLTGAAATYPLRCITCEHKLRRFRLEQDRVVMVKCPRCGTLQHRQLGRLPRRDRSWFGGPPSPEPPS